MEAEIARGCGSAQGVPGPKLWTGIQQVTEFVKGSRDFWLTDVNLPILLLYCYNLILHCVISISIIAFHFTESLMGKKKFELNTETALKPWPKSRKSRALCGIWFLLATKGLFRNYLVTSAQC